MSAPDHMSKPPTETEKNLLRLSPEFCPNCGRHLAVNGIRELPQEISDQLRWFVECRFCGAGYTIEVEP